MTTPILFDIAQRLEQLSKDLNVLDRLANALQASAEPGAQPIGAEHTLLIPLGTMTMGEIKRAVLEGTLRFTNGNRSLPHDSSVLMP